jgi:hypothetical protein
MQKIYYMSCFDFKQKNIQMFQDSLAIRRNFFVDLATHEANAWRKCLPSMVNNNFGTSQRKFRIDAVCHFGCICHSHLGNLRD